MKLLCFVCFLASVKVCFFLSVNSIYFVTYFPGSMSTIVTGVE